MHSRLCQGLEGVSVDYALPKAQAALPDLKLSDKQGPAGGGGVALRMRYSHLGCNVVHEDVAFTEVTCTQLFFLFSELLSWARMRVFLSFLITVIVDDSFHFVYVMY